MIGTWFLITFAPTDRAHMPDRAVFCTFLRLSFTFFCLFSEIRFCKLFSPSIWVIPQLPSPRNRPLLMMIHGLVQFLSRLLALMSDKSLWPSTASFPKFVFCALSSPSIWGIPQMEGDESIFGDMCHRITTGRAVRWWRHLNSGFVNLFFYLVVDYY